MERIICFPRKVNILSSAENHRFFIFFVSFKLNPKKKGDNNAPSESTASKSATSEIKGYETHSSCFDVDKETPDDDPNKPKEIFENLQKRR